MAEEICGQRTQTTYDSTFPYLPKRIEKYSENVFTSYIEFGYNSLGQLIKEDHSGSVTLWKYNNRALPCEKVQLTATEDPDVVTTYAYNHQGQCTEIKSIDGIQKTNYDIMGNSIESKVFSPSEELLSALRIGYDLNNAPIWKQTANSENVTYFDYHAAGLIKAQRQSLAPSPSLAYTLYQYDPRGYLIEEVDPRGYTTYRDYDALGNILSETKEGCTIHFSYEAGGLIETITSPSGAQITRHYTTNGLLKEENYPDGTKNTIVYDFFGRPTFESKNDISWEMTYDDANHRITRTHLKTNCSEVSVFDAKGNLVKHTDSAGFISEKSYDGLNRIKTETNPSGKQTCWNYQDNLVICTLPNGEIITTQYAAGKLIKSEVTDSQGNLIANTNMSFDPENDREEVIEGNERTVTWKNSLGLPIKIEKGTLISVNEYDACGNCIASIDGDGRTTRQEFDGLRRLVKKELPDGTLIRYGYDLDSNLTEYQLPNGNVWKATYDSMNRKLSEELSSPKGSTGKWKFSYENGYLKKATDPMKRIHTYLYDSQGRLVQESVENNKRVYTYDLRGFLSLAEQTVETSSWLFGSTKDHTLVKRAYDADGNLELESIYLNGIPLQETHQKWTPSSRSLQIGNHVRDFTYQNNSLVQVSTPSTGTSYSYDLGGSLIGKSHPLLSTTIHYNASSLPELISTSLPEGAYQEQLTWHPSGKLNTYTAPEREQSFSYNERGYLKSAGVETYDFDFGLTGIGVRTAAPNWHVPQKGLDEFGRILSSIFEKVIHSIKYNAIGEIITYGKKEFKWDPWGKLLKVTDPSYTWEASYDAFGRRLQTRYNKSKEKTLVTHSYYDPEEEFQEIGIQIGDKTYWKIYGSDACDSLIDETGTTVALMHSALRQLKGIVSSQETIYKDNYPSAYGPLETTSSVPLDLISYAKSLSWYNKALDPTGLIWMGARYYDSRSGRFISPDPISYPMCLDQYTYANGDPINYLDPDGRFASAVYQPIKATALDVWNSPRFHGALQVTAGFAEAKFGALATCLAPPFGVAIMAHGADNFVAGAQTLISGKYHDTLTSQSIQMIGMSAQTANNVDSFISLIGTMGGIAGIQRTAATSFPTFRFPKSVAGSFEGIQNGKNFKPFTKHNCRYNLTELTGELHSPNVHAHHVFPQKYKEIFFDKGINIHNPKYMTWWEGISHQRAAKGYNDAWLEFMIKNQQATSTQILEKGKQLMSKYGIEVNY